MTLKKTGLLCIIMMLSWTAYSQPGTEDRLYSAPIWKIRMLVHDAQLKDYCDSVNQALEYELIRTKLSLVNCDSLLREVEFSRGTWKFSSLSKDTLISNNAVIHKSEIKHEKSKGNKKALIGISIGFFAGLLL